MIYSTFFVCQSQELCRWCELLYTHTHIHTLSLSFSLSFQTLSFCLRVWHTIQMHVFIPKQSSMQALMGAVIKKTTCTCQQIKANGVRFNLFKAKNSIPLGSGSGISKPNLTYNFTRLGGDWFIKCQPSLAPGRKEDRPQTSLHHLQLHQLCSPKVPPRTGTVSSIQPFHHLLSATQCLLGIQ